jgi:alkanesulfonate monooxygenase SsuD/methylene tetrahydromethanopterin reductase-like flavin-dependent oxidoreductase (luciferase family)
MAWDRRGQRGEEHVALMRQLWCAEGEFVEFHGAFVDVPPVHAEPRPVQRPIPIYIGGHSPVALDRAGRIGDGWIAAPMSPTRIAELWPKVRQAATKAGRDPNDLMLLACEAPARGRDRSALLAEYAALGVDHLQVRLSSDPAEALEELKLVVAQHAAIDHSTKR